MSLSEIINVQILTSVGGIVRSGYGIPLVLSPNAAWVERVRSYSEISEVAVDFAVTTGEYLEAAAIFAQNPSIELLKIGRLANKPTQRWALTPVASNLAVYRVHVGANTATFTADGTATVAEITLGLTNAINALSGDTVTATDQTTFVRITGNSAGSWDKVWIDVADYSLMSLAMDHADPGVTADLDAIYDADQSWYDVVNAWGSQAMNTAIAAWVETNGTKIFMASTQETTAATVVAGSDTGFMKAMQTAARDRTAVWFHEENGDFLGEAVSGACLPLDPGTENWTLVPLSGPSASPLTATHRTNINAKNGNYYREFVGVSVTQGGKMASGEYIDTIRFLDWLTSTLQEDLFELLVGPLKVPFTDPGIASIEAVIRAIVQRGIAVGGIAADPAPVVIVPLASSISSADKAARKLTGVSITFTLAGAINTINPIRVLVSS